MEKSPLISIITIVYNGVDLLEGTIQSVLQQSYPHIEYIIVDGVSTDGTLDIIRQYEPKISRWISEKDKGLYDAMNKGIDLATGDFIWFMNCGDHIYEKDTVAKIVAAAKPATDVLYGEVILVDEQRKALGTRSEMTPHQLPQRLTWKSMAKGMVVCHQAFLPHRKLWNKYLVDNLTADLDWVIKCLKQSQCATPTQMILATYLIGGISKQKHQESLWDRYAILQTHFGYWTNILNHVKIVFRAIFFKLKRRGKGTY